jgi:DNA-binding CsgD family transcriptional regulator
MPLTVVSMVAPMTHGRDGAPAELTPREKEVLALLAQGKSTRQVAAALGITKRTVDAHVQSALIKTGAANWVHAIALAIAAGLIKLD